MLQGAWNSACPTWDNKDKITRLNAGLICITSPFDILSPVWKSISFSNHKLCKAFWHSRVLQKTSITSMKKYFKRQLFSLHKFIFVQFFCLFIFINLPTNKPVFIQSTTILLTISIFYNHNFGSILSLLDWWKPSPPLPNCNKNYFRTFATTTIFFKSPFRYREFQYNSKIPKNTGDKKDPSVFLSINKWDLFWLFFHDKLTF